MVYWKTCFIRLPRQISFISHGIQRSTSPSKQSILIFITSSVTEAIGFKYLSNGVCHQRLNTKSKPSFYRFSCHHSNVYGLGKDPLHVKGITDMRAERKSWLCAYQGFTPPWPHREINYISNSKLERPLYGSSLFCSKHVML